jgi:uncharacterized membrane protein
MAFCGNCGTQTQDGVPFCPNCGGALAQAGTPVATLEPPAQPLDKDAQDNKLMAILSYILFFIPLLAGAHKTSPFVKFHTNQGTVLAIASVAYSIGSAILRAILKAIFPYHWTTSGLAYTRGAIYGLLSAVLSLAALAFLVLCVIGILNAVNGKKKELPVIGKINIIK